MKYITIDYTFLLGKVTVLLICRTHAAKYFLRGEQCTVNHAEQNLQTERNSAENAVRSKKSK